MSHDALLIATDHVRDLGYNGLLCTTYKRRPITVENFNPDRARSKVAVWDWYKPPSCWKGCMQGPFNAVVLRKCASCMTGERKMLPCKRTNRCTYKKKESASYEKPPLQYKIHVVTCEVTAVVKFASTQKSTYKRRCHIIKIVVNISTALMAFSVANMAHSNQFHRHNQKVICLKITWLRSCTSSTWIIVTCYFPTWNVC